MGALRDVYRKLFTIEDKYNFHKTLGISCLLSYIYRFAQVGPTDMGFATTPGTLLAICVHTSLSVSSLIFRIPHARIKSGYRIWPEYRIHSIVFACRSLAGMLVTWLEMKLGREPNYLLNFAIVLLTITAADLGSMAQGKPGTAGRSSTIRDLDAGPAAHFFFSAMQFHATMGCMLGIRRYSTQFLYVFIIQFNAFLMTMRRKNLAPHTFLVTTYGLMLVFGYAVSATPPPRAQSPERGRCIALVPHLSPTARLVCAGGVLRSPAKGLLSRGQHVRQPRGHAAHRDAHAQIPAVGVYGRAHAAEPVHDRAAERVPLPVVGGVRAEHGHAPRGWREEDFARASLRSACRGDRSG